MARRVTDAVGPYGVAVDVEQQQSRAAVWAARLLAVLAACLAAFAVALPLLSGYGYLDELTSTPEVAVAVSFSATGALLVGNPQARRIGWLLLGIGMLSALYCSSVSWTAYVLRGDAGASLPDGAGLALATAWVSNWAWFPGWIVVSAVLPQVVPYGRPLPGRWWRFTVGLALASCVLGVLGFAIAPGELGIFTGIDNPLAVPTLDGALQPLWSALDVGVLALVLVALASVVVRVVRADGVERRQVGWVGYAVALAVVIILVAPSVWINLVVLLVPAGVAVAALRYRLYDLDLLVNRTLVVVALLGGAAVVYVALVAWVGALVGTEEGLVPFVAAFAVALAFHPARIRLQRFVDRLFFGRRGDPYSLLRDLDRALREAESPRAALAAAVDLVRAGLRLPGAGVWVPLPDGGEVQEQSGSVPASAARIPLELHGEVVGELVAAPRGTRSSDTRHGDADLRVLQALAGPLASAAYALRLTGDLEDSRTRLLTAREDERRRLRRDLHDGLGPQLAGVVMGLDVVGSALSRGDVDRAGSLATAVTEQARTAVEDVRRLVAGLRPPALDDLGVLGALRTLGPVAVEHGPAVTIEGAGDLDALPAAVEVAAYRIVSEAVTNAARHADASRVCARLEVVGDALEIRVVDDGTGIRPDATPGVGLSSMRERATELGGWCTVTPAEQGTVVRAHLPMTAAPRSAGAGVA